MAEPQAYEPVSQRGNRCGLQALLGGRLQLFRAGTRSVQWSLVDSVFRGQGQTVRLHQHWARFIGWIPRQSRCPQKVWL